MTFPSHKTATWLAIASLALTAWAAQAAYPQRAAEIGPQHPLLLFEAPEWRAQETDAYTAALVQLWADLDPDLRPYAALRAAPFTQDAEESLVRARALLATAQETGMPVAIEIFSGGPAPPPRLKDVETLLRDFTAAKGLAVRGLVFNEYGAPPQPTLSDGYPMVAWLIEAIDLAARYGRFISIHLDGLDWARMAANDWCAPLYEKMRDCADYVVPVAVYRGVHPIANHSAAMGLWLEGAASQFGIEAQSSWYGDARFIAPGLFGASETPLRTPSALYRAMILNGGMTGASVYSFAPWSDLWFGLERRCWDEAIRPTLTEIIDNGYIASKRFVNDKVRVAYRLREARTAEAFHLNLRDIDPILNEGFLARGAYGVPHPGQIPELIPDTGRHYWIPLLSAHGAPASELALEHVVQPGTMTSPAQWRDLLGRHYAPDGEGDAFIARIGRGVFIMNTHESQYGAQRFAISEMPAPVRQIQARREDDAVIVEWPFREGDVSYRVHKRVFPSRSFQLLARNVEGRRYVDAGADPYETAAYAVTALTNETEPYAGTVNYGDYLVLGTVESRIEEEVIISPLTPVAVSRTIVGDEDSRPAQQTWWPTFEGLSEDKLDEARAIAARIDAWAEAFRQGNLDGIMGLYSANYEDPQGWRLQYVRRAYQWFFERYRHGRMHRQIREWDFSRYETVGRVNVLLYCRFTGVALTDPSGRRADQPVHFPRTGNGETWVAFVREDDAWRILRTSPAIPNFRDILSWSAGPFDAYRPGPDL